MSDPLSWYSCVNPCLSKADILSLDEPITGRMSANLSHCDEEQCEGQGSYTFTDIREVVSMCQFNYQKWIRLTYTNSVDRKFLHTLTPICIHMLMYTTVQKFGVG